MFTLRFKFPDGFKVGAHFHTQTEHATVLAGVLHASPRPEESVR